jgi:hypothetical protein
VTTFFHYSNEEVGNISYVCVIRRCASPGGVISGYAHCRLRNWPRNRRIGGWDKCLVDWAVLLFIVVDCYEESLLISYKTEYHGDISQGDGIAILQHGGLQFSAIDFHAIS